MAWQDYQTHFQSHPLDESHFVLGLDLGDAMSTIAYFDPLHKAPEVIDISGGYGKASVPTVMQFAPETKEWILYGKKRSCHNFCDSFF